MILILLLWFLANWFGFPAWVSYVLAGAFLIKAMFFLLTNYDVKR